MAGTSAVEQYLAELPDDRRAAMEGLRRTIRAAAPNASESIAYLMPAFRMGKQFLVSYASFKRHYSLFPASDAVIEACGEALTPFLFGSGTIRFPASQPISLDLVTRIVEVRIAECDAVAARG
ncbi:MAG: iron chaperone [Candidatus Limnocylindrales bacterium]